MDAFVSRVLCNNSPVDQWLSHLRTNDIEGDISLMEQEVWPLVDELHSVSGSPHFPLVDDNFSDLPDVADYRQFDPFRLETILEEDSDVGQSDSWSGSWESRSTNEDKDSEVFSDDEHSPCFDGEVLSSRDKHDAPVDTAANSSTVDRSSVSWSDEYLRLDRVRCCGQYEARSVGTVREKVDDIWRPGVSTAEQRSRSADAGKKRAICLHCRRITTPLSVTAQTETRACSCPGSTSVKREHPPASAFATASASCESLDRRIEQLTYDLEEEEERSLQPVVVSRDHLHAVQFRNLVQQLIEQYRPCCSHLRTASIHIGNYRDDQKRTTTGGFCFICSVRPTREVNNFSDFSCDSYINDCVIPLRHFESDSALERIGLHCTMPESESVKYRLRPHQSMAQSAENLSEDSGYGDRNSPPRTACRQVQFSSRFSWDGPNQRRRQRLWALICRSERRSARVYSDSPCSHAEDPTAVTRHPLCRSKSQRSCYADDLLFDSDQEVNHDIVDRPIPAPRRFSQQSAVYQNIPTSSKLLQQMTKSSGIEAPITPSAAPTSKLKRSLSSPSNGARSKDTAGSRSTRVQNEDSTMTPRAIYLSDEETEVVCFRRSANGRPKPLDLEMAEEFLLLESAESWCPDNMIEKISIPSAENSNENVIENSEKFDKDDIETSDFPRFNNSVCAGAEIPIKLNRSRSMDAISHRHNTARSASTSDTENLPTVQQFVPPHCSTSQHTVTSSLPNLPAEVASDDAWLRALSAVGGPWRAGSGESAADMVGSRRAYTGRVVDSNVLAEREWLEASMEPESVEPSGASLSTVDATAFRRQQVPVKMYGSGGSQVQVFIARQSESPGHEGGRAARRTAGRSVQLSPYVSEVQWRETYEEPENNERPNNGLNFIRDPSPALSSQMSSEFPNSSPGLASNRSPILVSNKRPVLVSKRHQGSISSNTRVLNSSNGFSSSGSASPPSGSVSPQQRPPHRPSIQRVQVGLGSSGPGGGRHVITSERRLCSPDSGRQQYSVTSSVSGAKYGPANVANNNNNYHSVTNAKPAVDRVKQKSFLQKLGFSKAGSKHKSPRVTTIPSSPSSPGSLRFQSEAVTSTPFANQRSDLPHDAVDKLTERNVVNGHVHQSSEKHDIDKSFSSSGSVQGTSFSSTECTPKMILRNQKPPLPPQAAQKANFPSNRMRLHTARRSFLGVHSPTNAESDAPAVTSQPGSGPSSADADVKQAFQRFRDVTRQDRQRLAKSSPDVSTIESVTRSSVRLASVTPINSGQSRGQHTITAPSQRSREAESAFRAARSRVLNTAVSRPSSRLQESRLQYRETELGAVAPADPAGGTTAAERAKSMVHLPREDHADSSRAKSMEFLLDDANKAATLPPENQLSEGVGRPPSEVQLRFQRSLRNLNVPDWYRRSYRGEAALKRHYSLGASQPGGWSCLQTASRESLSSTWSGQAGPRQRVVVPGRVRTVSASSTTSRAGSGTDSTWQRSRPGSMTRPYLGWRSQDRLNAAAAGGYRTPAERLAGSVSSRAGGDIGESIRQVSSAIVDYFDSRPKAAETPAPRPAWRETSFLGRSPPLPSPRRAVSCRPDSAVLV